MLCKILCFQGDDNYGCRLLGIKNPVNTSQDTHYVAAIDPSQLILCKIFGVLGGNYEECRLMGYYDVWIS
jgi:hypothetical protein